MTTNSIQNSWCKI